MAVALFPHSFDRSTKKRVSFALFLVPRMDTAFFDFTFCYNYLRTFEYAVSNFLKTRTTDKRFDFEPSFDRIRNNEN